MNAVFSARYFQTPQTKYFVAFVLFIHILQNSYAAACWILLPLLCKVLCRMYIYGMLFLLRWIFSEVLLWVSFIKFDYISNVLTLLESMVSKPVINIYPVSCHFRICPQKVRFSRLVVLMRRFLHSWFFRCIAYFCLICCIFVNCSPIRAQAVILETILAGVGIVTGSILRGLGMGQDFTQQVLTRIF